MLGAAINQNPTRDGSISNHKLTETCKPINHNANDHKSRPQIAESTGLDYNTIMTDYTTGRLTVKRTTLRSGYDETTIDPPTHSIRAEVCPNPRKKTLKVILTHTWLVTGSAGTEGEAMVAGSLSSTIADSSQSLCCPIRGGGRAPFIGWTS